MHHFLCTLADEPVCFFKVPGNAGDALIQAGTMTAFGRANLRWEAVVPGDDVHGRTMLIGGGANLTPYYDHVERALSAFLDRDPRRVIVLPHTVRGQETVLARMRPHDLVVCRDPVSYQHVKAATKAQTSLAHDMAFHLDVYSFLSDPHLATVGGCFLDDTLAKHGWSRGRLRQQATLTFTRTDGERADASPSTDLDISHELIYNDVSDVSPFAAWSLLECVRLSRRIVTDRLHVAIGAGLLRVPTTLLPNSYDKNRTIFDHSLRRLRSVRFSTDYHS